VSNPKTTDFPHVSAAESYVDRVILGEIPSCRWVKLACERHRRDIKASKTKEFPYVFDPEKANRVCKFLELLPHVKGKWANPDPKTRRMQTMALQPWQAFVICSIFGWIKKSNGKRRFQKARIYVPRKNGKSFFGAGLGLYMLAKDDEPGAEVYSGATSEKQAWEVFSPARQMAVKHPKLAPGLKITVNAQSLVRESDNSKFLPVIGKPGDGASPHLAIIDEYHEHKTSDLLDTMETGMGAREQPLSLVISTAGSNIAGPCREDWKACEALLEGTLGFTDETMFAIIWTIDQDDEWDTEDALIKANPNWGISVNPEVILPAMEVARRDPRKQSAFQTKHLNKWVSAKNAYFNADEWHRLANEKATPEDYIEYPCIIGADFASKHDLVAMMQLFILPEKRYALFGKYYLPEATIELPENQHYKTWKRAGWLTETPGDVWDAETFLDDAEELVKKYKVDEVACDPNRAWGIFAEMQKRNIPVIEYRNVMLTMSEPMKELDALIRSKRIIHNGDPILSWAISNVTAKEDKKENVYPNKEDNRSKIDPVVSTIFALGRAMTRPAEPVIRHGFSFG
jgi:phage terminase large subunit-like protein